MFDVGRFQSTPGILPWLSGNLIYIIVSFGDMAPTCCLSFVLFMYSGHLGWIIYISLQYVCCVGGGLCSLISCLPCSVYPVYYSYGVVTNKHIFYFFNYFITQVMLDCYGGICQDKRKTEMMDSNPTLVILLRN